MTGVPRLQHLPVPAAAAGAAAVVVPEAAAGQRVRAVQPVAPAEYNRSQGGREGAWSRAEEQERVGGGGRRGRAQPTDGGRGGNEPAAGRLISFSRLTAMPFMVQVLGQQSSAARSHLAVPQTSLAGHRDAALLGSDIYRRAGGEPEVLPDGATFVRLAV